MSIIWQIMWYLINNLSQVLKNSICVAAAKSRPVLHHCVVIFFWPSGIMECTCMLFTFENGVPLMRQNASVVWHHSLLLINSFNKTEAAVFSCRLCFLKYFPFISLIQAMVCKFSPSITTLPILWLASSKFGILHLTSHKMICWYNYW